MKGIFRRIPKSLMAVFIVFVVLSGVTASVKAWWPERPTFTIEKPAPYVTFNSITNNPNYGDERTFFDVKPTTNTSEGGFVDKQTVTDGQELLVRVYIHNNAADNLNGTNLNGTGVAKDSKVRIFLPTGKETALRANAYVSASNANPIEVSDTVDFVGNNKFTIDYIEGSATMYTNAVPGGFKLNDSIVAGGASIGYQGANGVIPGCFQYTGIVTIKVKVQMDNPDFTVAKTVSKVTEGKPYDWKETIKASPGETVAYQLRFANVGNTQLDGVVLRDQLPKGFKIVPNSTLIKYGSDPKVVTVGNDAIVSNGGLMVGSYKAGSGAVAMFKATAPKIDELECGDNNLKNIVEARANGMATTDNAFVTIHKECEPPKPQSITCDALKVDILNNKTREVEAKVTGTASNTTITGYKIDFGDGKVVNQQTAKNTYGDYGKYTIKAYVTGTVDGKTVTVGGDGGCVKTVEFTKPPEPQSIACSALTVSILNKDSREVEAKVTGTASNTTITGYKIDFGDSTVVNEQTAKHTYGDYGKYTIKAYVTGTVDGKAVTVGGDGGCVKTVEFTKPEPPKQAITCDVLTLNILNNKTREVEAKVTGSAQNTTITGYKIDFGDGTVVDEQTAKHTFADYGKYTVKAHVSGTVDGKLVTVSSDGCVQMVEFKKPPEPTVQSIKCDALTLDLFNKDKKYVKVSVKATAQNTKIDKYSIDFGDGSAPASTQTAEHTYSDYGTYKIVASVTGMVDGKQVTDSNVNCEQTVEFKKPGVPPVTPPPAELPNTGAGALIGLFSGVSILGAVGHRMWTIKKMQ